MRELLVMEADVNAYESADFGDCGPFFGDCGPLCTILYWIWGCCCCCPIILIAIGSARLLQLKDMNNYKKTPLHVAVTTGDPDMVALLLEFGADRNAPATFWNYCCCCKKTPTQFVDMFSGGPGRPHDNPAVQWGERAPIKELLIQ